mgnify:CR=1 FL=1
MDSFEKHLRSITGIDTSPLAYLLREDPVVPAATNQLLTGKCYSETHGSLCEELVVNFIQVHVLKLIKLLSMIYYTLHLKVVIWSRLASRMKRQRMG